MNPYAKHVGKWFVLGDGSRNRFKVIDTTEQVYGRAMPGLKVECYRPDGTKRMAYAVYPADTFESDFTEVEAVFFPQTKSAKESKQAHGR